MRTNSQLKRIAQLPPGKARKIAVDAFTRQAKAKMGAVPAKSLTDFLVSADPETINRFFEDSETEMMVMDNVGPKELMSAMGDDTKMADSILKTQISVEKERGADREAEAGAANGGSLTSEQRLMMQDRRKARRAKAELMATQKQVQRVEGIVAKLRAAGVSEGTIEARIGPQLQQSTALFNKAQERFDKLQGNVRENKRGVVEEERKIQGELRQDALGDQDRWQAAAVDLAKQAKGRKPVQVIMPDGTGLTALTDDMGNFYDPSGQKVELPPGARIAAASLQGGAQEIGLTPASRTEIQQGLMQADAALTRLDMMMETFKPEFLTLPGKGKAALITGAQKLGIDLPENMDVFGNDFAAFSSNVQDNLNVTIKDLTGAAMTAAEVPRIEGSIATMNRSPEQFVRVMAEVRKRVEASKARLEIYEKRGIGKDRVAQAMQGESRNPLGVSLDDAQKYVDKKNELRAKVIAKEISKEDANENMRAFLSEL